MSAAATLTALGGLTGGLSTLVDELFTTEDERLAARLKILELQASGELGQLDVNKTEARHKSIFVAGWRPAIGWIGAVALGWNYILLPIFVTVVSTIAAINGVPIELSGLLNFNMAEMMPIILGMLGLGAARSFEKVNGVHSNNMRG